MPDIVYTKVTGLPELEKALNELPEKMAKQALQRASRKSAQIVQRAAQAKAPVHQKQYSAARSKSRKPGQLRRGILVSSSVQGEDVKGATLITKIGLRVRGTTSAFYGIFIEKGWVVGAKIRATRAALGFIIGKSMRGIRGGRSKRSGPLARGGRQIPGRPFLGPAFEATKNRMLDVFIVELHKAIEKMHVKLGRIS